MDMKKLNELLAKKKAALKTVERTIKVQPGQNRYVVLPGWKAGEEHVFFHDFGQHYIKDVAGNIQAVYPCQSVIYGKACPICSHLSEASRHTDSDDVLTKLDEAKSRKSFLLNVLALDSETPDVPQILEVPVGVFSQIMAITETWSGENVFDPVNPQVIVVNREGKGLNTKYMVQISPNRAKLPSGIAEKIHNLDEYVDQANEEKEARAHAAINALTGWTQPGSSSDTPSTPSTPARASGKSTPPPVIDDELDDLLSEYGSDGIEA